MSKDPIASVQDALISPLDYEVSFCLLGWTLSYMGGNAATLISASDANEVIAAISDARHTERDAEEAVDDAIAALSREQDREFEQSCLDEEAGV